MDYIARPYQQDAIDSMIEKISLPSKSLVSLPTGSGKSIVIADFVNRLRKPVIILQPSREILAQNREKLLTYVLRQNVGTYSASFNKKQIRKYTFATIQSVYKKQELFEDFPVVIIDEAHLYKQSGMFDKFIKGLRKPKVFGLTATPFRMEQKKKYNYKKRKVHIYSVLRMLTQESFNEIIYTISTKELLEQDYLAPLKYITQPEIPADFSLNSDKKVVESFQLQLELGGMDKVKKVVSAVKDYKSVLVFCPSVNTARLMNEMTSNVSSAFVSGDTPAKKREKLIKDFKDGKTKVIYNCNVLTTGFDHPALDCIVLMRPTKSLNLYNQMIGRGVRKAKGKDKCTVFDITGTVKHLGKLEDVIVKKDEKGNWNVKYQDGWGRDKIMSYYKASF